MANHAAGSRDRAALLVHGMNGEALPRDHGCPLRALVPGWVRSASIKWLSRIVVSSEQQCSSSPRDDDTIDKAEAIAAIDDYFGGLITKTLILAIIDRYLSGG